MKDKEVKRYGLAAENYFAAKLNSLGIMYDYRDDWFDYVVSKDGRNWIKVEVKSCIITHAGYQGRKRTKKERWQIGKFDFTNKEAREQQAKENIWICFILRWRNRFMLLGFCRARLLQKKRYVSLHKLRELRLLEMEEWLKLISNAKTKI